MRARAALRLALVVALACALALAVGCGAKKPKPTTTADDPAGRETCFKNQIDYEAARWSFEMKNPGTRAQPDIAMPVCPAGGDYAYDPTIHWLTCSIHGHRPGE